MIVSFVLDTRILLNSLMVAMIDIDIEIFLSSQHLLSPYPLPIQIQKDRVMCTYKTIKSNAMNS
jgi:hypothetical protein